MEPERLARQPETVHQRAVGVLQRAQHAAANTQPAEGRPELVAQTWRELTTTLAELLIWHEAFRAQPPHPPALAEYAPDGYLVTDLAGRIHEANEAAAALFAVPLAEIAGKRLTDLVAPEAMPALEQDLADLLATDTTKHREAQLVPTHGPPFAGAYVVVPARDGQGSVIELRWLVWDLSARQRHDQALLTVRQAADQTGRAARLQTVIAGLVNTLTADQVLAAVVQQGAAALGPAEGVLNLLTDDGLHLTTIGLGGPEARPDHYREFPLSAARPSTDVLRSGEPLWIESHQDFSARYPDLATGDGRMGAVAVLPLSADQQRIGALAVSFPEPRTFPPEDQGFLLALAQLSAQALARQRALAAENTRLRQEVGARAERQAVSDRALEHLHNYSADLAQAREDERHRLALDLHDQLGGALTALKMDVYQLRRTLGEREPEVTERLSGMSDSLSSTLALVRDLATELRPPVLDALGLPAALEWTAGNFATRYGLPCRWVTNTDDVTLDSVRATAIFRVVQECLTNIVRHAAATAVTITLAAGPNHLTVTVADDGRGFVHNPAVRGRSMGLASIHERVRAIGGRVEIATAPGQGTRVQVQLAWPAPAP